MKKLLRLSVTPGLKNNRGVSAIVVAITLTLLISAAALAIDVGYMTVTKNELQNVADGAALAATGKLGCIYSDCQGSPPIPMSYEDQQTYVCDPAVIKAIAIEVASKNRAAGENITINDADITIGLWNGTAKTLTPTLNQPDAVMVVARRDASANGPITTFFARIFGVNTANVTADATAALTGESTVGEGGLPLPVGISAHRFETEYCDKPIKFNPTNDLASCGGWHTYTEKPPNDARLRNILQKLNLVPATYMSPEAQAGVTALEFIGGNLSNNSFAAMEALFNTMKVKNDGVLDNDEDSTTWTTTVVVYESSDCANPNKLMKIVGFAEATITGVLGPPDKMINAKIKCDYVDAGRGGGGNYGTKGSIPGLVE